MVLCLPLLWALLVMHCGLFCAGCEDVANMSAMLIVE